MKLITLMILAEAKRLDSVSNITQAAWHQSLCPTSGPFTI